MEKLSSVIVMVFRSAIVLLTLFVAADAARAQRVICVDGRLASPCADYSPATRHCGAGTNTAYPTIKEAADAATAGTTVLIRGGVYFAQLVPARSGAPGQFITFQNYGSELVSLEYPGTHLVAIDISGRSNIIIDGLRVEEPRTYWLQADNASDNIIRNCVFKHTPATGTRGNLEFVYSVHNLILSNDIEDGQDDLTLIESASNLVQGNIIKQGRHSIFGIRCGSFNILRGNYFSNSEQKIGEVYDCGRDTHAVSNLFDSTRHNVIEDNIFAQTSTFYATAGGNGIQYAGQRGIIRRNIFHHCNAGLGMQVYPDESLSNIGNRIYNNVFYTNVGPGIALWPGTSNNIFVNNVFFGNRGCINDCLQTTPGQIVYRDAFVGSLFVNNDLLFQVPGQPVIEREFRIGYTLFQFTNLCPGIFCGVSEVDPQFVNAPHFDFHLQPTSPLIDAGAFLTSAASSGAGTNLPVLDVTYFRDGFGIPSVEGDTIQLQNQPQTARITHVDYDNNVITLDLPLTWTNGQGISLRYTGRAPDLGAFEYTTSR